MKIVADEKIPFIKGVFEPFSEVIYKAGNQITNADLKDAQALITRTRTVCNEALLANTNIEIICSATIGYDHIDTTFCDANHIVWKNAVACNSESVAQYITAALLHLADSKQFSLNNKTIGVVGVGNVGKKVVQKCKALGMNVLMNDPPRQNAENSSEFVSLEEIVAQSDIITLHVPLSKSGNYPTYHLVDDTFIGKMNKGAFLINSSRGSVVNNLSLKKALINQQIAGAVLDVWENEPELDTQLLDLVDIGTPHIAGYSTDGKANAAAACVHFISQHFEFEIKNWYPLVPQTENRNILVNNKSKKLHKEIKFAVDSTYSITNDSNLLRQSPHRFELLRNNYPIRREFAAYQVLTDNANTELIHILQQLGFKI